MRSGIRQQLVSFISELKNCYEPNVPTKDTLKPYAVVVQGEDTDNGEVVGFKRTVEISLYENRTTFKNLDALSEKVIKALDMQVINDAKTNETFTCIYDGTIEKDTVNEAWDAISRKLKFTIIGLHEESEVNTDPWLEALSNYTKNITNHGVYLNKWTKDFQIPGILWRVKDQGQKRENNVIIKESKTLICHIVSRNKNEINSLLNDIEDHLITDLKIPLDLKDRRYLTVESISDDREADMLSKGQLTVKLFRRKTIKDNNPTINKIHSRGALDNKA